MTKIVLHQWEISPFCGKIAKILKLKNLTFSVENYNGLNARKAAKLSHTGKLPVLEHGSAMVQDSSDIAAFLEERYPEPSIYPSEPGDKARAHFWEDWADESLYWYEVFFRFGPYPTASGKAVEKLCEGRPGFEKFLFKTLAGSQMKKLLKAQGISRLEQSRVESNFVEHLDMLAVILEDRNWLVGDTQSIADIAVSAQLDEMIRTSHMKDKIFSYNNIKAWLKRNNCPFT